MSKITVLDQNTINQIAAGEVIERPAAVVKELVENSIDAGSNAITVEIKEGGISFIRITDNGSGIDEDDMPFVFLRHSTSKIKTAEDLLSVTSLGFRGEALSSISAIAQVELVTKTSDAFSGVRYMIAGGEEKSLEHIGCPNGTTFIIRNLFFNTPARRKFLKSPVTEAGYISDVMERLAVSHPNISFKFIINNQVKLHTSGNNNLKDIIYNVYGREISSHLVSLTGSDSQISVEGFIAKPIVSRGNRNYENYFINGRYIKSNLINKAIEEAYKPFIMTHRYPFTSLHFQIDSDLIDVNVHPAKLEIRFKNGEELYQLIYRTIKNTLEGRELIPSVTLTDEKSQTKVEQQVPEPFELKRRQEETSFNQKSQVRSGYPTKVEPHTNASFPSNNSTRYETLDRIKDTEIGKLNEVVSTASNIVKEASDYAAHQQQGNQSFVNNRASFSSQASNSNQVVNTNGTNDSNISKDGDTAHNLINEVNSDTIPNDVTNEKNPEQQILINQNEAMQHENQNTEPNPQNTDPEETSQNQQSDDLTSHQNLDNAKAPIIINNPEQLSFISEEAKISHRIIGQVFSTYWIVEFGDKMFLIDQHAAHEKVLYEKTIKALKEKQYNAQLLEPPIILTLSMREEEAIKKHREVLEKIGFEIEEFGGKEYAVRAVPSDLYGLAQNEILIELIDELVDEVYNETPEMILEKVASMSCKAAVKGNHKLSFDEARALIDQLLQLENPYHCPHGRPTIISMSKYEIEKKFKRIV